MMYRQLMRAAKRYQLRDVATGRPIQRAQWVSHPFGGKYRVLHITNPVWGSPMALVERRGGPRPGHHRFCVKVNDGERCMTVLVTQ
jgi:hypothetical protein